MMLNKSFLYFIFSYYESAANLVKNYLPKDCFVSKVIQNDEKKECTNMRLTRFLIVLFIASLLASCSNNDDDSIGEGDTSVLSDTDMPIVDENIELKFFAGKAPATHDDWNDVLIYNEYEDMTNIDIKWEMVPFDSMEEKRNLALSGGNLPDAFHSAGLPTADLMKYGEQGVLRSEERRVGKGCDVLCRRTPDRE